MTTFLLLLYGIVASIVIFLWKVFVNAFAILPILLIIAAIPPYRSEKFNVLKIVMGIWFIHRYWS